jgi:hypothetical protein
MSDFRPPADPDAREWQCPECSEWVPVGFGRHCHLTLHSPSLDELIMNRRLDEMGGAADISGGPSADVTSTYWRTGREVTRR